MNEQSMGTRVLEGLNVSLIGMTITIATLVILAFVIMLLSRAVGAFARGKSDGGNAGGGAASGDVGVSGEGGASAGTDTGSGTGVSAASSAIETVGAPMFAPAADAGIGGELVAVFAAAIAAVSDGKAFRIVSYRKTGQAAPAWNIRARNEYLSGKL